ncbi:MAG: TIGR02680 family protein, partial [Acidobacteriota bacterium]
ADAEAEASTRLASERADLDTRTADAQALYATLDAEREALEAGVHVPPPAPHTRDDAARADRPGAPLWQLIDRAPDLDDSASAGLEAALEASGLLDAWVTPDGRLEDRIDDTTLIASGSDAAISEPTGPTLADVLRLDEAPTGVAQAIEPAILGRILRSIGLVEIGRDDPDTAVWVATDGRFRVGPLRGAWHKEAAEHLGASAREARRQRRLTALADELDAAEAALDVFQRKAEHLDERAVRVRREAESAPDDTPMHRARAALDTAAIQVDRERRGLAEAEEAVAARRREHDAVVETARRDAEALGVTRWLDDPDALVEAVGAYREALAALWPTLRRHLDLLGRAVDAEARTRAADERLTRQHEEAESATRRAHQTEVEHQTLEATLGARVEEIQARLAAARHRHDRARAAIDAARDQERELSIEHAIAAREIEQRVEELSHHDAARSEAVGAFGRLETTRLLAVAVAEMADEQGIEQSVTRAVDLARRIESALSEVDSDDDAWERVQNLVLRRIEELKHDLLPHDMSPEVDSRDGLYQVQARFRGRVLDMAGLHAALADAVEEREQILSSKEKEILENHLIGEVSSYLHERLREAEEMVLEMNRELAERPTSTGMALRFVWQPRADGPDGLATARGLLLGNLGTWSSADRQAVGEFLHRTIQRQRDDDASGTWQEHLRLALDYRDWHVFGIERRHDDQWRRLTRRTHGTGSGGEKAIALTMPQFAAASAHYNSAKRPAPRLILLDEAFVGVDADMRAKCMGLLGAFDLDFVMTSEREWGCYSTLPGVAIVQLSTLPGVDATVVATQVEPPAS